jgi:hypothetical protein
MLLKNIQVPQDERQNGELTQSIEINIRMLPIRLGDLATRPRAPDVDEILLLHILFRLSDKDKSVDGKPTDIPFPTMLLRHSDFLQISDKSYL